MPQIILKNMSEEKVEGLALKLSKRVAEIIDVPTGHIVVERADTTLYRNGRKDELCAMAWVSWKKRGPEMQQKVSRAIADILFEEGYDRAEVIFDNLDMNDFYEYEKE